MGCCTICRHHTSLRSRSTQAVSITNFESRPFLRPSSNFIFDIHQYKLSSILEVRESLEDSPIIYEKP